MGTVTRWRIYASSACAYSHRCGIAAVLMLLVMMLLMLMTLFVFFYMFFDQSTSLMMIVVESHFDAIASRRVSSTCTRTKKK